MWKPKRLYSQNFEDLYLWRIFNKKSSGFYIDVGTQHHQNDSVTKIFYDQGWSGINIEPVPELFKDLQRNRVNDVNLPVAVSSKSSISNFNVYGGSGLGTLKEIYEANIQEEYLREKKIIQVQTVTLNEIFNTYCNSEVDFLKIDVEGSEKDVLEGLDLKAIDQKKHPKVILLEVTIPNSRILSSERDNYLNILAEEGYVCFFFDGLNDYFCKQVDKKDFERVTLPPNVFDEIVETPSKIFKNDIESNALNLKSEEEVKNLSQKLKEHIELCNQKDAEKKELQVLLNEKEKDYESLNLKSEEEVKNLSQKLKEHIELCNQKDIEKIELQLLSEEKEKDHESLNLKSEEVKNLSQKLEEHIELCHQKDAEMKELQVLLNEKEKDHESLNLKSEEEVKKLSEKLNEYLELCNQKDIEKIELQVFLEKKEEEIQNLSQKLKEHIEILNLKDIEEKELQVLLEKNEKNIQNLSQKLKENIEKLNLKDIEEKELQVLLEKKEEEIQNLSQKLKELLEICDQKDLERGNLQILLEEKEKDIKSLNLKSEEEVKNLSQTLQEHIELCFRKDEEIVVLKMEFDNLQNKNQILLKQIRNIQLELEKYFLRYTSAKVLINSLEQEHERSINLIKRLVSSNNNSVKKLSKFLTKEVKVDIVFDK